MHPKNKGALRLDAKQPKFDVIDSSRKIATGRNLREQLRNIACSQAVVRSGCRTVSNNGSGSGLAPAQNILAVLVWFGFT